MGNPAIERTLILAKLGERPARLCEIQHWIDSSASRVDALIARAELMSLVATKAIIPAKDGLWVVAP